MGVEDKTTFGSDRNGAQHEREEEETTKDLYTPGRVDDESSPYAYSKDGKQALYDATGCKKEGLAQEEGDEMRRLKTLGDGPVAPVEAKYNAMPLGRLGSGGAGAGAGRGLSGGQEGQIGVTTTGTTGSDGEETMGVGRGEEGWVEPGWKGWLCVLGVSAVNVTIGCMVRDA